MTVNIESQPLTHLKVTLLLETLTSGKIAASVFEFPNCRVEADNRDNAIAQLQENFLERLQTIETISWDVLIASFEPAWMQFAGVFKDDPDFQAILETIREERLSEDDTEVDPSYYQYREFLCLDTFWILTTFRSFFVLTLDATIVTRNRRDFELVPGIKLLDWTL
jgi:hypothetical protein